MSEIPGLSKGKYGFEGTIRLAAWAGFQSRDGVYGSLSSQEKSDGTCRLDTGGDMADDDPRIREYHVRAFEYLTQHQEEIKNKVLDALLVEYKQLQELYGYEGDEKEEFMPDITHSSEFSSLIGLSAVHLMNVEKEGVGYVGFEFGCTWDEEHGLGIMTYKDRVIKVGEADSSFLTWVARQDVDPSDSNQDNDLREDTEVERKPWWKFW